VGGVGERGLFVNVSGVTAVGGGPRGDGDFELDGVSVSK